MSPLARQTAHAAEQRRRGEAALLAATEALVAEGSPFSDLSVDAIAKRAGFSRATFYAYFADKRALALALGEQIAGEMDAEIGAWLREGSGELRDQLAAVLRVFTVHRGALRALVEGSSYDEEVAALWRQVHQRFRERARARLLAADPALGEREADARAYVLVWSTERSLTEHLADPTLDEDALLDALVYFWRAALDGTARA